MRGLLEDGREFFEKEVAHSAQDTWIVGIDADEETDTGSDEEVEDECQKDKFH